jgi:hypothetical protein
MSTPDHTLDDVVRAAAAPLADDGEVITDWVILCGTRDYRHGGGVILVPCMEGMPTWLVKGLIYDAADELRSGGRLTMPDDGPGRDLGGDDLGWSEAG